MLLVVEVGSMVYVLWVACCCLYVFVKGHSFNLLFFMFGMSFVCYICFRVVDTVVGVDSCGRLAV